MDFDIGDAFQERQSGRTSRMLAEAFKHPHGVIIMANYESARDVQRKLPQLSRIHVTYYKTKSNINCLHGRNGPVFVDHYVWEQLSFEDAYILNCELMTRLKPKTTIYIVRWGTGYDRRTFNTYTEAFDFKLKLYALDIESAINSETKNNTIS